MLFIKRIFLFIPIAILLNGCFGGLASLGKIAKFSAFMHIFTGWGGRIGAIRYFSQEHAVTFYAIIIIFLLIVAFVIFLEVNSQVDYLIRPYQILLGISLIAIVIYIFATAPEQKELEKIDYRKFGNKDSKDPYEDEKQWLTDDSACQKLDGEINKYYCMEIKDQCSKFLSSELQSSKEDPKFLFGQGHFQVWPFRNCADQLREKFKIGILSFDEELKNFQNFIFGERSETSNTIDLPSSSLEFEKLQKLRNKPQDITGDRLRTFVIKILSSASETNEGDLEKVWLEVESQLTEVINKIIKDAYEIDDVVANGFGNTRVPFYTRNFVNRFKRLKISYSTIDLTELLQKKLDTLVNELNKVNDQIDILAKDELYINKKDSVAISVMERLNEKREKIQEDILNLKYDLKDSND